MSENQKEPQYKLRWNEDLRDKVMVSAKENNRSINQEIIARLEKSFENEPALTQKVDISDALNKILGEIQSLKGQ
ncbi:Arc family DNA-binding protein [Acinetobacter ursingii]|uniref:Arc family DNA-binding protein n=1 Tax=Acinetobacter ursingii TaxID=108980 RepID=UPI003AF645A3